jgi:hypothetical protein
MIEALPWEQPSIRMYGKDIKIPRLTCWMGESSYTFEYNNQGMFPVGPECFKKLAKAGFHVMTKAEMDARPE